MTRQRTIKEPASIEGVGLQTGGKAKLTLKPSPIDSGISFIRADLPNKPLLNVRSNVLSDASPAMERRTAIGLGPFEIQTVEHLLAALSGLWIDNIIIELDNAEPPGLDGSAKGYVDAIQRSGIVEQDAPRKTLEIKEAVWCEARDALIAVFPSDEFRVSYTMSYGNAALGTQFFDIVVNESNFTGQIAPARTFCLEEEALALLKMGLGKGASCENTLVMGKDGPIKNSLRFPDEPVRHKVLDLIGDLYLIGMPIRGRVVAIKSGHALNLELVKKLKGSKN